MSRWLVGFVVCALVGACSRSDPGRDAPTGDAARSPRGSAETTMSSERDETTSETRPGTIPIEEVAKYPQPGTSAPTRLKFVPGTTGEQAQGSPLLTYLHSPEGSLTRQLYVHRLGATGEETLRLAFDPPEGGATEENLSAEEKLRRERMRERGLGVTSYTWARKAQRFLVPVRGDIWVQDGLEATPRKVVDADEHPALDARFSRDGQWIAYVMDAELHVVPAEGGTPRQITQGARGTGKTHGLAEYIAQEEMGRHHGYWWSHDGEHLAYTEVDETHIPVWRIVHQGRDTPSWEDHGYPFAGAENARVRLGVVPRKGGRTVWMDLRLQDGTDDDLYLARVHWMPDGALVAQLQNREQTRLELVRFDPRTGKGQPLRTETSDVWINLHSIFEPLEAEEDELRGAFVWASEASGFRHLHLVGPDGRDIRHLTEGDWMVDGLVGVDEARGLVYFTGTKDGPTQKHLYRVPLAGGEIERLTEAPGMHGIVMDETFDTFVDQFSALDRTTTIEIRTTADGRKIGEIEVPTDPRIEALGLRPPRLTTLPTRDGVELHAALYEPDPSRFPAPWPTLVSVYGGPHAQRVQNAWGLTADMRAQFLRDRGYLVLKVDNRGSARRGLAFEGAIKHDMGNVEVQDQVDGVRWAIEQGLAAPTRVGIYGWSYGGYMAAMALARAPETFRVGVAGAPVTHWDGYDTHYTERYMGTPQSNPEGYARSSVMAHVDAITGKLLLVHGLIDENVHFRHTARLVHALVAARKEHEVLMFPDERHMPRREEDRVYMEERVFDFIRSNL
jgi:dipeptidyl-peptidase 4